MKTIIYKVQILLLLVILPILLSAQPPWFYTNTGDNHTILIQTPAGLTINGITLSPNDYVGVFYDSLGTLACGGYEQFSTSVFAIAAWGTEAGVTNGFAANEQFIWKIWRAADGAVFNATPTYLSGFTNQGNYASFGMSGVFSLDAIIGSDLAIGNLLSPISGCGTLSSSETISYQVINVGSDSISSFVISYSIDGGINFINDTINQVLEANSTYLYTSSTTYDFYALGNYDLIVSVIHPYDVDLSNNAISQVITNGIPPIIDLSGLTTSYCTSIDGLILEGLPSGGVFSSNSLAIVPGNLAYFTTPGAYDVYYTFTDSIGCSSTDTVVFDILPVPDINFADSLNQCDGDIIDISVPSGYSSYLWSTGSTDTVITVTNAGLFSITVTNAFGCITMDSIPVIYSPNPIVNIQGDTVACEGESIILSVSGQGTSYLWSTGSYNDIISVTQSNTYTVSVSSNGCIGTDNISVYFNPAPPVDLGADIYMCEGESVTLDAGSFTSYLWNDGSSSQTITVIEEGTYYVTVTNSIACEGSDEINVFIVLNPVADFSFIVDNYTVSFTNESFYEDPGNWEWLFGDGNTSTDENPVHTYTTIGDYDVYLKISNSCGNDSIIISLNILDIYIPDNNINITVVPNPSNGQFTLEFKNNLQEEVSISVINSLGQVLLTKTDESYSSNISMNFDIKNQPSGLYFINVKTKTLSFNKKIIIN